MEKLGTFLYGAAGYLIGAALMVGGWWLSMLNISIDRYSGTDFTNFWTLLGLGLIFVGAYLPFIVIRIRSRRVSRRQIDRAAAAPPAGTDQPPPTAQDGPAPPVG
jgi:hypothetical protein